MEAIAVNEALKQIATAKELIKSSTYDDNLNQAILLLDLAIDKLSSST